MEIQVGDVFLSEHTGNRWKVIGITLGANGWDSKVRVERMQPRPRWDDGKYVFSPESFKVMRKES